DPAVFPTASPAGSHRIQRRSVRPVAVRVRVEDRLDLRLQPARGYRLRDPIGHGGHTEDPDPIAMRLRYLHRFDRRWEVGPRGHPIPDLVQVVAQILPE